MGGPEPGPSGTHKHTCPGARQALSAAASRGRKKGHGERQGCESPLFRL